MHDHVYKSDIMIFDRHSPTISKFRTAAAFVIVKISSRRTKELYAKICMSKPDGELSSTSTGN